MILLIDNYDSFAHNLARYLRRLGQEVVVRRNDQVDGAAVAGLRPRALVISPGPCTPREAGCTLALLQQFGAQIPILGVCLGHQALSMALGGGLRRAREPMHGRTSPIWHDGQGVFRGLKQPLTVCRYHSLIVDEETLPAALRVTARTADGTVMALAHREHPWVGVQFHPESVLTEQGYPLLANFLQLAGFAVPTPLPSLDDERWQPPAAAARLPSQPVTF